ncbi:hypothetical protein MPSI1_000252 [Malassezia psittaci]|uniref:Uncharacterized protein n=1 Tax=Malassezia psittaci TaxID=1821823 RepID=A0AAF0F8D4_9BASI|nr:hypothetical protein MPSI1_000252 [Malassezia psittaci]
MKRDKPSQREAANSPSKDRKTKTESDDASSHTEPVSEDHQTNSPSVNILERAVLSLAGNKLPPSDAAARTLAQFKNLHRLDLSDMKASEESTNGLTDVNLLVRVQSLSKKHAKKNGMTTLADRLTWLNLSNNKALGQTKSALDGLDLFFALHALVLSHNQINEIPYAIPHLPDLNTLVLSNNRVTSLPNTLPASLPNLKKLSISHNHLEDGSRLPDFSVCSHLREVRLSGNPSLKTLPDHLSRWGCGVEGGAPGLALLDVSDCGLDTWDSVAPLLKSNPTKRKGIVNLCLRNNGVTAELDYEEKIRAAFPALSILDNVRLRPKKAAKADTTSTSESLAVEAGALKHTTQNESHEQLASNPGTKASKDRNLANQSNVSPNLTSSSKSHNKVTSKQKRAHDADDDRGKKIRKRSGRGSKHAKPEVNEGVNAEQARLMSRAGPAPSEFMDSDQDSSGMSPREGDSIFYRADGASSSLGDSEDTTTSSKPKKTRRKKRGLHTVELNMEVSDDETAIPSKPEKQETTSKQASKQRSPSPQPATQETGVVDIVQKRKPKRSQPPSLARRDEDLAGW